MIDYGAHMRWPANGPGVFPRHWLDRGLPASTDTADMAAWICVNIAEDRGTGRTMSGQEAQARLRLLQLKAKVLYALAR